MCVAVYVKRTPKTQGKIMRSNKATLCGSAFTVPWKSTDGIKSRLPAPSAAPPLTVALDAACSWRCGGCRERAIRKLCWNCAETVYFSQAFPHTCFDVSSANSGSAAGWISLPLIAELSWLHFLKDVCHKLFSSSDSRLSVSVRPWCWCGFWFAVQQTCSCIEKRLLWKDVFWLHNNVAAQVLSGF